MRVTPALLALALALLLAGCLAQAPSPERQHLAQAVADTRAMTWAAGNWWAYHATVRNVTLDITLVVHDTSPQGSRLGTNASAGFFGLPFSGNVTRELGPMLGSEEWPLYRFPLEDGKTWSYKLFGYDAKTTAHAALVDVAGVGPMPGFTLDATAYGQTFARYDYTPRTGWFTHLALWDPAKHEQVLDARLTDFGPAYGRAYFVEQALREVRIEYPTLPSSVDIEVPSGYARVEALLVVSSTAGVVDAQLRDARGYDLASARSVGIGQDAAKVGASGGATWRLDHKGVGQGVVHLEVTGLTLVGSG